ncbi:MAG TPA: YfcE family phosphodiesterase [Pseudomonas sp.]|uniref:metallophosphoesterase family protein n=1 Tax=Stutzerimonas xanthomarina TaxID=271420 RepID=UPI000E9CA45E|nr:metallophosphoesterase family protein [Stutzerimonas xanthomarina]MBU0812444.1 metallophosphatase family protein [Gammaproteobacteria bacterium]HAQ87858.1 YfcE family phosphodiesterase [Pseudomonas sp.]MBK3849318.1 YfcE family phosphodiesterase [Stutzerimonas xanthomarina]MBU0838581.1 metallophosphatase family protein [Gammaproteobacteria bacterium]MBU1303640.1 metallophosphatase family protein [Gammaproteobacteria bacterium]|tara:strand:- start:3181 stop:3636 length:456 start_codon:yes stop_codon:yes gene_type:complete
MRIGVISDTHGLLRPEALAALQGCERIIHAGDIGKPEVLEGLRALAPLDVIRGNVDSGDWAAEVPEHLDLEIGGLRVYVTHDVKTMGIDPIAEQVDVVIAGHSHQPKIEQVNGVLYLNPGSAGRRRFTLPISLALLDIEDGQPRAQLVTLG